MLANLSAAEIAHIRQTRPIWRQTMRRWSELDGRYWYSDVEDVSLGDLLETLDGMKWARWAKSGPLMIVSEGSFWKIPNKGLALKVDIKDVTL